MKKFISVLTAAMLMVGSLSACGSDSTVSASSNTNDSDAKMSVVTTIFPEYDWVMNVLGDNAVNAEVTMLLDNGVDLHSYQPTTEDIAKIASCDVFIYVGGESDEWVEDALKEATNENMVVIDLLDELGDSIKEEEVVEGMQEGEHEHEHEEGEEHDEDEHDEDEHDEDEHDEEEEEVEYDEHVWLSLKNTEILVERISEALAEVDTDNAESYKANSDAYIEKLADLDSRYEEVVETAAFDTVLFGDRFPFRYLVDDYGLSYYAAFVGCSAETEASFETITFLAEKVDELGLKTVLTIEGQDHKIAETIVENTSTKDQSVLTMDSMQSTTSEDVENGTTYLSVMEANLEVLKEALN